MDPFEEFALEALRIKQALKTSDEARTATLKDEYLSACFDLWNSSFAGQWLNPETQTFNNVPRI